MEKHYSFLDKANVRVRKTLRNWNRGYNNWYKRSNIPYKTDRAVPVIFLLCVIGTSTLGIGSCQNSRANTRSNLVKQVMPFLDKNKNEQLEPAEVMEIYNTLNKPYNRNFPNQDLEDYLNITQTKLTSTP